jgi:isopenicillin-N N-acyltransferase-like protein
MRKWLCVVLLAVLLASLVAGCSAAPTRFNEGYVEQIDGVTVLHVKGGPYDMGLQQGVLMRQQIKGLWLDYLRGTIVNQWKFDPAYLLQCAKTMEKHIPAEYIEEMKGIAEGSGLSYEDILILHTHSDTVHYGHGWGRPDSKPGQCSNFAVWGDATADRALLHGRNLDWNSTGGAQKYPCVIEYQPFKGNRLCLIAWAGAVGSVTGMNDKGITYGEMTSSSTDETLDGMPLFIQFRYILQHANTLEEAVQMQQSLDRTTGWNMMLCGGKIPDARALEVSDNHVSVFAADDPKENNPPISAPLKNAIRRTNHYIDPELQKLQAARAGIDISNLPREALAAALMQQDTWQRYDALGRWITEDYGKITPEKAIEYLGREPVGGDTGNLHSVVFRPAGKELWVAFAGADGQSACRRPYTHISFADAWK